MQTTHPIAPTPRHPARYVAVPVARGKRDTANFIAVEWPVVPGTRVHGGGHWWTVLATAAVCAVLGVAGAELWQATDVQTAHVSAPEKLVTPKVTAPLVPVSYHPTVATHDGPLEAR